MRIKKTILSLLFFAITISNSIADEGMWIPSNLEKIYANMQKLGLTIPINQMYDVNNPSIKDAIVMLDYGQCTAEIISPEGLMLTNHHCGYGNIQFHSTVAHDYLKDGFWAYSKSEELPCPGKTASLLVRIERVTDRVLQGVAFDAPDRERNMKINETITKIVNDATQGTTYEANVFPMLNSNEYYLYVYETYRDIRLVGAPPSSIGKFGGDTDNWMWPRHTGDFSMFRIYTGPDGKPAEYSANNVPLKPKFYFPVSLKGYKENDFAMIWGFPGSTDRYLPSYGIKFKADYTNAASVKLKYAKMQIMKEYMDKDQGTKIKYADKYAYLANFWKKDLEETKAIRKLKVVEDKYSVEQEFKIKASQNPEWEQKYGSVINEFEDIYKERTDTKYTLANFYFFETTYLYGCELLNFIKQYSYLVDSVKQNKVTPEVIESVKLNSAQFFKDYDMVIDKKIFAKLLQYYYEDIPKQFHPGIFKKVEMDFKGDFSKYADYVYENSVFSTKEKLFGFLKNPDANRIEQDPAVQTYFSMLENNMKILTKYSSSNARLIRAKRMFLSGQREMQQEKDFYPDANSTMRITYGKVIPFNPRDAVHYDYTTTLEGIMEKEDSSNDEFIVPEKLKNIYDSKDYGRYAIGGKMPVCFLTDNDITGGNSGSPVMNGSGELIGIAFDGNSEAMSSDLHFDPALQRCINVDIRYVLLIIEKYAGASNLISEMKIVQ
ncbi:MAG: S46 family peptidase [Ignavibacteria bacterium]|nr:S46 family peptidase [Ignavibacteria bacterium]